MDRVSQGQPVSPLPPYWKASVDYAASIAVAYAGARAIKASDPATFEQFTADVVTAVAEISFEKKLDEYAACPTSGART